MDLSNLFSGLLNAGVSMYTANQAADAAQAAGQAAAQAAQFRPVGITTRFGRTGFQYDPASGRVIGAGYQAAPDIAAMREAGLGLAGGSLQQALDAQRAQSFVNQAGAGLFNLGQQYIAQSPQGAAMQYMAQQADLLSPLDERNFANLYNKMYRTGTLGLSVGATGPRPSGAPGLAAANPMLESYFNQLNQRNAQLATQAQQAGMQQTQFGQGLLGGALNLIGGGYGLQERAYAPFQAGFNMATGIENQAGAVPFGLSTQLGGGSPAASQAILQAQQQANAFTNNRNTSIAAGLADPVAQLIGGIFR